LIHHIYIVAESAFATTIAATDADDVAIMSIESEGNFNQAMVNNLHDKQVLDNLLHGKVGEVQSCIESGNKCGTWAGPFPGMEDLAGALTGALSR
jgi:hypothetical protein